MQHLDEGTLQTWLDRERAGLDPSELAEIERHLATCDDCARRLAELESLDERAHGLLGVGASLDVAPPPFDDVVSRARGTKDRQRALSRLRSLAWAASIVVALGVGWMTNDIYRGGPPTLEAPSVLPTTAQERAAEPSAADAAPPAELTIQSNEPAPDAARRREAEAPAEVAPNAGVASGFRAPSAADDVADAGGRLDAALERNAIVADADGARDAEEERQAAGLGAQVERPAVAEPTAQPSAATADAPAAARAAAPPQANRTLLDNAAATSQREVVLSGRVEDGQTGQGIENVQVYVDGLSVGTLTDEDGRYTLELPPADEQDTTSYEVMAARIGYESGRAQVAARSIGSVTADFTLREQALQLQEVVVTGADRRSAVASLPGVSGLDAWSPSTLEAAAEAGAAPRYLAGLPVLSVETNTGTDGVPSLVRVRQRLASGDTLTLVQGRAGPERAAWPVEPAGAVASRRIGEVLVTGTAPLQIGALLELLAALR